MGDFLDKIGLARVKAKIDTALSQKLDVSLKGSANGLAELDSNGNVFASQLPSYVDDVIEYQGMENFPTHGESEKIYIDTITGKTYRWGGTTYAEVSESLAIGETSNTAYRGDRGKIAYDHAAAKGSAYAAGLYRITTNAEGHVVDASAVVAADVTTLGIPSNNDLENYAPINNPVFTGSISMGRDSESVVGANSLATGERVIAAGLRSHAEGLETSATGANSHAEGNHSAATIDNAHAEGEGTTASAYTAHAEGLLTVASGQASHAEGSNTIASGSDSHAEGSNTIAIGTVEHVSGRYNVADTANEWVSGTSYVVGDKVLYNTKIYECFVANEDVDFTSANWQEKGNYLVVVGNGNSNDSRSNAYSLDWNGNEHVKGDVFVNSSADGSGGTSLSVAIRSIERSGTTFTATRIDGTTFTFTQQDKNTQLSKMQVVDMVYPVGSIYMSVNSTNPGTLLGGTWTQLKDRFLLGVGDTYRTAEATGGAASQSYTPAGSVGNHTLTTSEIPSHNHTFTGSAVNTGNQSQDHTHTGTSGTESKDHTHTGTSGNPSADHTHTGPSHTHTGPSHTHTGPSHAHSTSKVVTHPGNAAGSIGSASINPNFQVGVNSLTSSYAGTGDTGSGGTGATGSAGTGKTGTVSAWHTHKTTTGGVSQYHTHTTTTGGVSKNHTHSVTAAGSIGNTGGGGAHNHGFTGTKATISTMPPYLAVYMWKRTA